MILLQWRPFQRSPALQAQRPPVSNHAAEAGDRRPLMELLRRAIRRLLNILGEQAAVVAANRVPVSVKAAVPAHPSCYISLGLYRRCSPCPSRGHLARPQPSCELDFHTICVKCPLTPEPCGLGRQLVLEAADDFGLREIVEVVFSQPHVSLNASRSVPAGYLSGNTLLPARFSPTPGALLCPHAQSSANFCASCCQTAVPGERAPRSTLPAARCGPRAYRTIPPARGRSLRLLRRRPDAALRLSWPCRWRENRCAYLCLCRPAAGRVGVRSMHQL